MRGIRSVSTVTACKRPKRRIGGREQAFKVLRNINLRHNTPESSQMARRLGNHYGADLPLKRRDALSCDDANDELVEDDFLFGRRRD
jgi:hypothetical protein